MGVKDPDVFMALVERSDELMARKMAVLDGSFAVGVEAEGYPAGKNRAVGSRARGCSHHAAARH
jgi:hypothetical protein